MAINLDSSKSSSLKPEAQNISALKQVFQSTVNNHSGATGIDIILGPGYPSAGAAMVITIVLMILLNEVHPPAVSTSLSFALHGGKENNLILFSLALGITVMLVLMERCALGILGSYRNR